jgi:putative endonuclease
VTSHRSYSQTGKRGEDIATEFLRRQGYTILARNYRIASGEIDIIAREDNILVFIEVKTCRSSSFGEPETWVSERKQQQIEKVALGYLQEHDIQDVDCRFDVVAVKLSGGKSRVKLIKDAFWL